MNFKAIFVQAMLTIPVTAALANSRIPSFEQFPVNEHFIARQVKLHLAHRRDVKFRNALSFASRQPVNFAGHYILTTIACGASCVMTAAINAQNGTVSWLPFSLCCWNETMTDPVQFRVDSDLVILHGQKNEAGGEGPHYFRLIDDRLLAVSTQK